MSLLKNLCDRLADTDDCAINIAKCSMLHQAFLHYSRAIISIIQLCSQILVIIVQLSSIINSPIINESRVITN